MENTTLLKPTLHVEVLMKSKVSVEVSRQVAIDIHDCIVAGYESVHVDMKIETDRYDDTQYASHIEACLITDFTGPQSPTNTYHVEESQLDVQTYSLHSIHESGAPRRRISHPGDADDDDVPQARVITLPNIALTGEWESLIYDDGLPARLLRYLTRMLGVMKQPGLDLSTFNWNRLVLLHGPPGSGKSTLCRALAQRLSIRLSTSFPDAMLVEVNTNAMLSKYFGESGKLIGNLFEKITRLARSSTTLVCVVIDEVETIAGSRQRATDGDECSDGLRATNQLLTALDKVRSLPNIIVLCTSNMIGAMDFAFLDRVDIKQLIPSPSSAARYNIFRSCLNELVRTGIVGVALNTAPTTSISRKRCSPRSSPTVPFKRRALSAIPSKEPSSPLLESSASSVTLRALPGETSTSLKLSALSMRRKSSSIKKRPSMTEDNPSPSTEPQQPTVPTYRFRQVWNVDQPQSYGGRVWTLAEKCVGFSGRTLRRLPILGLAMYTWGGECSLHDAISALESAIDQELKANSEQQNDQKSDVFLSAFDT